MSEEKRELVFWPDVSQEDDSLTVKRSSVGSMGSPLQWEEFRTSPVSALSVSTEEMRADKTPPAEDSEPESEGRFYSFLENSIAMPEKLFKVIIIGDPTVGKTSFVQRYVQNTYKRDYKGTVGVDFALKILKWSETQTIKLQLWDIAGQERFTWMTRVYYKDAHGCVIMFDLTNKNSFVNSLKWKRDVDSKCSLPDGRPIPCMLLANKCDLSHRQVDLLEVESFHKEHHFIGWTETSAKEGLMVNDSMRFLVDIMMRQDGIDGIGAGFSDESLRLTGAAASQKKNCAC